MKQRLKNLAYLGDADACLEGARSAFRDNEPEVIWSLWGLYEKNGWCVLPLARLCWHHRVPLCRDIVRRVLQEVAPSGRWYGQERFVWACTRQNLIRLCYNAARRARDNVFGVQVLAADMGSAPVDLETFLPAQLDVQGLYPEPLELLVQYWSRTHKLPVLSVRQTCMLSLESGDGPLPAAWELPPYPDDACLRQNQEDLSNAG